MRRFLRCESGLITVRRNVQDGRRGFFVLFDIYLVIGLISAAER
uniref:Transposase n=1 Tax=Parascaris equorum TaxID=6256 RepID=A0A914S2I0_PAREQ